jgi:hypothetical protein
VVVVSAKEWARRAARKESFVEFLNRSPLKGSRLETERPREPPRDVEL